MTTYWKVFRRDKEGNLFPITNVGLWIRKGEPYQRGQDYQSPDLFPFYAFPTQKQAELEANDDYYDWIALPVVGGESKLTKIMQCTATYRWRDQSTPEPARWGTPPLTAVILDWFKILPERGSSPLSAE